MQVIYILMLNLHLSEVIGLFMRVCYVTKLSDMLTKAQTTLKSKNISPHESKMDHRLKIAVCARFQVQLIGGFLKRYK